jgi:hypothetical protein
LAGLSWWSPTTPAKSGSEQDEKGKNSPVEGVVQPVALITLPPPREVARLEIQRNCLPTGNLKWVTVYGYCLILSFVFYGYTYLLFGFNLSSSWHPDSGEKCERSSKVKTRGGGRSEPEKFSRHRADTLFCTSQNVTEVGKNKVIKTQGAKRYLTLNLIDA